MDKSIVATASIVIDAPAERVWKALTSPEEIERYMFGTNVTTDWKEGSHITWKGVWQGRPYQDHGTIERVEPGRTLGYSHFSPLMGRPDRPENYHHVTIQLEGVAGGTRVTLRQDNNATEEARKHSETNWRAMLEGLKKVVEG